MDHLLITKHGALATRIDADDYGVVIKTIQAMMRRRKKGK
jgi:hypothetical protein